MGKRHQFVVDVSFLYEYKSMLLGGSALSVMLPLSLCEFYLAFTYLTFLVSKVPDSLTIFSEIILTRNIYMPLYLTKMSLLYNINYKLNGKEVIFLPFKFLLFQ